MENDHKRHDQGGLGHGGFDRVPHHRDNRSHKRVGPGVSIDPKRASEMAAMWKSKIALDRIACS